MNLVNAVDERKYDITCDTELVKEENNYSLIETNPSVNHAEINENLTSENISPRDKIPLSKLVNFFRRKIRVKSETEKMIEIEKKSKHQIENNLKNSNIICFSQLNVFSYSLKRANFICEMEHNKTLPKIFDLEILEKRNRDNQSKIIQNPEKDHIEEIKSEKEDAETNKQNEKYKRKVIPNDNYVLCLFCGEVFLKREFRNEHLFLHTDDLEMHSLVLEHMSTSACQSFHCDECDSVFNRQLALIEHINEQHEKVRPVKCHLCDRKFPGIKRTRAHVRSSHQVKTFKCDMCSYISKNIPDLEKHKLGVHSNQKIMCNVCGKLLSAFHHNLKKHLETHNETRPYKCDLCEMAYKTRSTLAKHRENIHFPVSIMCSLCGTISASKLKYKKHIYKCKRRNKKIVC